MFDDYGGHKFLSFKGQTINYRQKLFTNLIAPPTETSYTSHNNIAVQTTSWLLYILAFSERFPTNRCTVAFNNNGTGTFSR